MCRIALTSLAIVLVAITLATAQQGPTIPIYTLEPDSQCALWLRMSGVADTTGLTDAVKGFYVSGVRAALPAAGIYPHHLTELGRSANNVVVGALDAACAQQPAKPIVHVLLNLLGYR